MAFAPRVVSTAPLLTSRVFDVERVDLDADGLRFSRDVVRHRGAVAILAFDGTSVALVRQWRAPVGRAILEIPAGTRDVPGEDPADTARRELEEEAGLVATSLERLCEVWNSPGWSDQRTIIYLATGLAAVPARPSGPEEEAIVLEWLALADAISLTTDEDGCDASTAIAVLALARRLGR